jgi:hypothetical protein
VIVCFVDTGTIVDHHYSIKIIKTKESLNSDGQQFYQYQQNKQSPLT